MINHWILGNFFSFVKKEKMAFPPFTVSLPLSCDHSFKKNDVAKGEDNCSPINP